VTKIKGRIIIVLSLVMAAASGRAMAQQAELKVSNSEALKAAMATVQPEYPVVAQQLHLEGAVEIEAHIGEDGSVDSARPLTGNAILADAAIAAIKQWKFAPFMVGGKAMKAIAELAFKFKL
jgi:TonB family protein